MADIKLFFKSYCGKIPRYALFIIVLLHLFIAIYFATSINIWIDEASSLNTTNSGLITLLKRAIFYELQAPFYFLILGLWRSFNETIIFARLLSALFTCGTIYIVSKLSERFFKQIHPGWVGALVAFNPFTIWVATEIRCYALVLFLSALLLLFFIDGYLSPEPRNRKRYIYVMLSVVSLYTHYYLGFQLVAHALVVLFYRKWSMLRSYMLGMVLVGACFLPMLLFLPGQIPRQIGGNIYVESPGFLDGLQTVHWYIRQHLISSGSSAMLPFGRFFFHASTVAGLILLVKWGKKYFSSLSGILFVVFSALATFFLVLANIAANDSVAYQHSAVLFIPTVLLAVSIILLLNEKKGLMIIWILITFLFYTDSLINKYSYPVKTGDWKRVASYVESNEVSGEAILFFTNWGAIPFSYYYKGINKLIPLPEKFNMNTDDIKSAALKDEKGILEAIETCSGRVGRLWIVTQPISHRMDVEFNPQVLENFIEKYCSVIQERKFYGSTVRYVTLDKKVRD